MSKYGNNYGCNCGGSGFGGYEAVTGNSIDIKICECQAGEVRADLVVETDMEGCNVVRLWGQIKDCMGKPVPNALLKLVKVVCTAAGTSYQGIAHTVSDCEGFYQFDLCYCDGNECYKVLVSKAYTGPEQIIDNPHGNCGSCLPEGSMGYTPYRPCKTYEPIITPGHKCGCEQPVPPCPPHPPIPPCPPVPPCPPHPPVPPRPPVPPCPPYPQYPQCGC